MSRLVSTTDRRLIRLLQQNARVSFAELSRVTGIPESTVRRRVERMQERGIIRFAMIADADQLGYDISAMVGLRIDLADCTRSATPWPPCRRSSSPRF